MRDLKLNFCLTCLAYLSLVPCMVFVWYWNQSYRMEDTWTYDSPERRAGGDSLFPSLEVSTSLGEILVTHSVMRIYGDESDPFQSSEMRPAYYFHRIGSAGLMVKDFSFQFGDAGALSRFGFAFGTKTTKYPENQFEMSEWAVIFPFWLPVVVTAAYPAWRCFKFFRDWRREIVLARISSTTDSLRR